MPRKRKKNEPNDILSTAIYMGLVALVRLASKRTSEKTRKFYTSIDRMWRAAREDGSFSSVQRAEPNMRGQFLRMVWVSTRRFGNRETKRVYSWLEGTVGALNGLLNYAGARLRDLAMTCYPFPEPETFYIRKYSDGRRVILTEEENDCLGKDDAVKTYKKSGYRKMGKSPQVLLSHPTLPEMDFVDMIRAHLVELCRQCFIHNVPRSEAHKYIQLLIHRLQPFLDWVYTDGEHGRPYFNRYSDHELREMLLEIRSLYGRRIGSERSITKTLDVEFQVTSIHEFEDMVIALREDTDDEEEFEAYSQILDHINEGRIVQRDIEKLIAQVLALRSKEGTEWHRILLSGLHHPRSLKQVVFAGDTMLDDPSSALIVGELPVSRRKGQVDLVIFLRRGVPGRVIWTPVMILEVKTKGDMEYNLYGFHAKDKSDEDYVASFYAWKRVTSEQEWRQTFSVPPSKRTIRQLDAYETEVLSEYRQVASMDPTPPTSLWKGVIVLDAEQNPLEVFEAFHALLGDLVMGLLAELLDTSKTTSYTLGSMTPRVAAIIIPSDGPAELLKEACAPQSLPIDDPFRDRVSDDRLLTLYISIPSPTSSGIPAATIATTWHLLHHIKECRETSTKTEVYWLDLMGHYSNDSLVRKRFGLDALLNEGRIGQDQYSALNRLIDDIRFIDLSSNVDLLLTGADSQLDAFAANAALSIPEGSESEKIMVIDGWPEFSAIVPSNRMHLIRSLEVKLLDSLPTIRTNVIWIDNGVEHTQMNQHYQRKCVSPLPHDSPRRIHLDEIIYNIPTPSRGFGRLLPKRDDERFIVQDVLGRAPPWRTRIHVPRLIDYSKRFRGGQGRKPHLDEDEVSGNVLAPMYARGVTLSDIRSCSHHQYERYNTELEGLVLTLVPSTLRPRTEQTETQQADEESEDHPPQLISYVARGGTTQSLTLSATAPPPTPPKTEGEFVRATNINQRWHYERFPSQVSEDEEPVVTRPPVVESTDAGLIDTRRTRALEMRRLLRTAQFLRKRPLSEDLLSCCKRIEHICCEGLLEAHDESGLLRTLELVRDSLLEDPGRMRVWETVRPIRLSLLELLNSRSRKALIEVMERNPDALLLYGNNLFLTVLAALDTVHGTALHSHVVPLWQSVVEWELYQLGFTSEPKSVSSKYDLHALYSNLLTRAKTLPTLKLPETSLAAQKAGQVIWVEDEERYSAWVILPTDKGLVAGLIDSLHSKWLYPGWYECITDPQVLMDRARQALFSTDRNTVVISTVRDHEILWMHEDGEEGPIWSSSIIEHGSSQRMNLTIPWLRFTQPYDVSDLYNEILAPPISPIDIEGEVDGFLREIASIEVEVIRVTCEVGINTKHRAYEVEFRDRSNQSVLDTLLFKDTSDVVKLLRHPIRSGVPLRMKRGSFIQWDHQKDIHYTGCQIEHEGMRETFSVSFLRPLVCRSRFHPDEFLVPRTCEEILSTTRGKTVTLTVRVEATGFSVDLSGVSGESTLQLLAGVKLNFYDLALLAECEQLIDIASNTRHYVEIDANGLQGLKLAQVSDYPRLREAVLALDEAEYDWSKGSWCIKVSQARDGSAAVLWDIRSQESSEVWMNRTFTFELDFTRNLDQHINIFRDTVRDIISLEHITGFSESLQTLRDTLMLMGLGKGKPRCRLHLEVRGGRHVAVLMRVEPDAADREIGSFPLEIGSLEILEELMVEDGGPLSYYDIMNLEEFYELVRRASSEKNSGSPEEDEAELLTTIKEYRMEQDHRGLAHALVMLTRLRLSQERNSEAMAAAEEAFRLLSECNQLNRLVRSDLAYALTAKAAIILGDEGNTEMARELLGEAKELVQSILESLGLGWTDVIVQETGAWIDRLSKRVDELSTI